MEEALDPDIQSSITFGNAKMTLGTYKKEKVTCSLPHATFQ
jgi:hypothetical protein